MAEEEQLPIFVEPQCLVETDDEGKLTANQGVLRQLQTLDRKMVVVAIAGLYRTGKSYLMNRLAGKSAGFALGSTIQSKTKGIWIWVRPHATQPGTYLVLMDTEGLGDAEKGDANHDNWIFTLSTLLSSTLVYNFLGAINDDMITKLQFVTEISKRIKTRMTDEDGSDHDFDIHFPLFIMALRDFCLDLEIDGQPVTADQYLEHLLILGKGKSQDFIESRRCIRKYFKTRKCFTFDRPTSTRKLRHLETLSEAELGEDFLQNSEEFTEYVYQECPVMKLPNGHKVNGAMFASLVESYVEAIREGVVPCVENAFVMMANQENRKAIDGAIKLYREQLRDRLQLPTETEQELSDVNMQCQKEAIGYFTSKAIMDVDGSFQKILNEGLLKIYIEHDRENKHASQQRCLEILNSLDTRIKLKLQEGEYTRPGGFQEYIEDVETLKEAYSQQSGLGVEKERMIDDYINASASTSASILAADEKMSEEEKKVQEMKQEAFRLETQRKRDEEEIKHLHQMAEENLATMEETKKLMEQKHQEEMEVLKKQQQVMQDKRIKEQERLLTEGFKKESEQMKREIELSRQQFVAEQKNLQDAIERERMHQQEIMEAKLREQKMEHEFLLQLEQTKAENRQKEGILKVMEENAQTSKEEHEAMVRKMSEQNQEHMSAMEKMHQATLKTQYEQQQMQRELEMKRMEQDMERGRLENERQREERERAITWQHEQQKKLEEERSKREEMDRKFTQENAKLRNELTNAKSGGKKGCILM